MAQLSFENVFGQAAAKRFIAGAYQAGRLAHGYLFVGPDGIGKLAMAIELAKALVCTHAETRPCQVCTDCKQAAAGAHPNIAPIFPYPRSAKNEEVAAVRASIFKQPYAMQRLWASPNISIQNIRQLRHDLGLRSFAGQNRIHILIDVEKMTAEATNSLLKLLEEPPDGTYFVLITSELDSILPTVRSRCQTIKFTPLQPDDLEQALQQFTELDSEARNRICHLAMGSVRQALDLAHEDVQTLRQDVVDLFRSAFKKPASRAVDASRFSRNIDRKVLQEMLQHLLLWVRDAHILAHLGAENARAHMSNIDDMQTLERFVQNFPHFDYDRAMQEIERSIHMIDRYVQPLLLVSVLLQKLGSFAKTRDMEKAA